MTVVVSVETLLLVVLVVLVAGLLRSHAEILRRLGPAQGLPEPSSAIARSPGASAPAVSGVTPGGDPLAISFQGGAAGPTLLAFLTSGCSTCAAFWDTLGERRLPEGVQTLIVARGSEREQPGVIRRLAPAGVPVVMSSDAWGEYAVPGAPYFVLVDGEIRGEGVATTWQALGSLVTDAIADQQVAAERSIDDTLAAAGIGPDHPSLYPAGRDGA